LFTDEQGRLGIPDYAWEDSQIYCGAIHLPVKKIKQGASIPGRSAGVYGELAILPVGWGDLRASLRGERSWHSCVVNDSQLGHRFLYLMPGHYEIADRQGVTHGEAPVSGLRSS
jgi:hypothetical protein